MEETNYDRKHAAVAGIPVVSSEKAAGGSEPEDPEDATAKKTPDKSAEAGETHDMETAEVQWPRKTFVQKLSIVDKPHPNRLWDNFVAPFEGFTYPAVVYGGCVFLPQSFVLMLTSSLMYGANNLVWQGTINSTIGTVYTTQYGFSTAGVAAAYAGGLLGSIVGGLYAGKVGRILALRLARRHGGISEPEDMLWLFAASVVLVPFSSLLYGLGVAYHVHWFGLVFSQFLMAINASFCVAAGLNYAIGSYKELSGGLVVTCVLIRNTLSFAINYAITPWVDALGYRDTYISVAVLGFAYNMSFLVMIKYGKKLREMTAARYWRAVALARERGLSH